MKLDRSRAPWLQARMKDGAYLAAFALIAVISSVGCQLRTARVLNVDLRATEKDVIICSVEVSSPFAPEQYFDWARRDLRRAGGEIDNPFFAAPVYELCYRFHSGPRPLATVLYRRAEDANGLAGTLQHAETIVFHSRLGAER